jgi:FemAB-related protein (PEP-CTERM system-associated)
VTGEEQKSEGSLSADHNRVLLSSTGAQRGVFLYSGQEAVPHLPRLEAYVASRGQVPLSLHPGWSVVLAQGLKHSTYCLEAQQDGRTVGVLVLAHMQSVLFGRFLVSLPYLNYGGVQADDEQAARELIDRAVVLADQLKVRYLELRHESATPHAALPHKVSTKVNMRLPLPGTPEDLWKKLDGKVRNQVRKAQRHELKVAWGGEELLSDFYQVFSQNMRDLGTPVYSRNLFRSVLRQFPERAELCVVQGGSLPIAAALLLHGWGVTEVPSASSLRSHNHTCCNMLLYWHLLERAIGRKQSSFDFGRCSLEGGTYPFKKQWGAVPSPTGWQFYLRHGGLGEMNPHNPRFRRYVRWWQRLPVSVTRLLGPPIVRGIP